MSEITYHCEGDYLIPDLIAPKSPEIGIWGYRRRKYLLKSKELLYTGLFLSGNLNAHLEDVDRQANEMFDRLIKEYAAREGITEELKMKNHLEWVQHMNQIRAEVEEIVNKELIFL
ncbi:MAG: TnpV protein [Oscillospiraceae bacterium]|nr:TnpV protein [Oscillospiraceae bacterium]